MSWQKLQQEFLQIVRDAGGPMKSGCGTITVDYGSPYAHDRKGILVVFGGYCISDWSRHKEIGPFESELDAFIAASAMVASARERVREDGAD